MAKKLAGYMKLSLGGAARLTLSVCALLFSADKAAAKELEQREVMWPQGGSMLHQLHMQGDDIQDRYQMPGTN